MGIFGGNDDEKTEEIEELKGQIRQGEARRKELSADLAAERKRAADLAAIVEKYKIEAEHARAAVRAARRRQNFSVEKAKRLKVALGKAQGL
jgi:chromosome segregation ATPase